MSHAVQAPDLTGASLLIVNRNVNRKRAVDYGLGLFFEESLERLEEQFDVHERLHWFALRLDLLSDDDAVPHDADQVLALPL
jgi:hypothetical protein